MISPGPRPPGGPTPSANPTWEPDRAWSRWQAERRLLERDDRDRRWARRRRGLLIAVVAFLLVDVGVSIGLILSSTSHSPAPNRPVSSSSAHS